VRVVPVRAAAEHERHRHPEPGLQVGEDVVADPVDHLAVGQTGGVEPDLLLERGPHQIGQHLVRGDLRAGLELAGLGVHEGVLGGIVDWVRNPSITSWSITPGPACALGWPTGEICRLQCGSPG